MERERERERERNVVLDNNYYVQQNKKTYLASVTFRNPIRFFACAYGDSIRRCDADADADSLVLKREREREREECGSK